MGGSSKERHREDEMKHKSVHLHGGRGRYLKKDKLVKEPQNGSRESKTSNQKLLGKK